MRLSRELLDDAQRRVDRHARYFEAQESLLDLINHVLENHIFQLGERRNLSLLVGAALGKATKSFQAITRLCFLGFGEDALLVLRSNLNLMINVLYVLRDANPSERAEDFIAYSYVQRDTFIRGAFGKGDWLQRQFADCDLEGLRGRAAKWERCSIAERAKAAGEAHYRKGYKFYSSIEHSDAMALNDYIVEWNERGPHIDPSPGDKFVDIALIHSLEVMAEVLVATAEHFGAPTDALRAEADRLIALVNVE